MKIECVSFFLDIFSLREKRYYHKQHHIEYLNFLLVYITKQLMFWLIVWCFIKKKYARFVCHMLYTFFEIKTIKTEEYKQILNKMNS